MKLTLAEPKYLRESISIISDLVNEASFRITPDYIELIAMDPGSAALVIFKLLSSTFVEYKVDKEEKIGLNLNNLKQVLKRAKPSDLITLEINEDKLNILIQGRVKKIFSLPIIDLDEGEQKIPDLAFTASITTQSDLLNNAIEDASIVSDVVMFVAESSKFSILAKGDLNSVNIELKGDDKTKISVQEDMVKSRYSIEYLKKMIAGSKLSDTVDIEFKSDYPLKLTYTEVDKVSLSFILAPRGD